MISDKDIILKIQPPTAVNVSHVFILHNDCFTSYFNLCNINCIDCCSYQLQQQTQPRAKTVSLIISVGRLIDGDSTNGIGGRGKQQIVQSNSVQSILLAIARSQKCFSRVERSYYANASCDQSASVKWITTLGGLLQTRSLATAQRCDDKWYRYWQNDVTGWQLM